MLPYARLRESNINNKKASSGPDLTRHELEALIGQVKDGDAKAFAVLYDLYAARIYRYIFYKVNHTFDAEDLTAEVFLRAFEKIQSYEVRECPFSSWLYRIAHNAVVDYYRLKGKEMTRTLGDNEILGSERHNPEIVILSNLDSNDLCHALQKLTDEQREVVLLRFIEGLPAKQVAEIVNKPEGAVRALQRRGLKAISRIFSTTP